MELVEMTPELIAHVGDPEATHYVAELTGDEEKPVKCLYLGTKQACIRFMRRFCGLRAVN